MRDFIAKFNKLVNRILVVRKPTTDNQKMLFIGSMPLDISFQIRHVRVANFLATQTLEIKLEDDMIAIKKCKTKIWSGASTSSATGTTNNTKEML